ncbi:MAG TPA: LacI family DNA-binding transcriptional regulator [Opitutaceae bacterium]|nr:LacI family DNA-binding transcriptional regulator [Opitutaceae bacterium]
MKIGWGVNPFTTNLRPTLQDIARLAGVGKATVSLALRDHPKISSATRERVKAAAAKLDYRPDPALARIAAHRWKTREHPSDFVLAFITIAHPWSRQESVPILREAAMAHATLLGYRVEHFKLEDYASPQQLARVLFHRGIRGVIVGQILREDFYRDFPWQSFTCVGCHVGYFQPPVNIVIPDFHHAIVRVWREAMAAGYRRIGVALLREMQAVDLFDKVSAVLFCQARVSPDLPALPMQHFSPSDLDDFKAWMKKQRPDVVLGFNDTVCWWLGKCGVKVGKSLAFASLDTVRSRPYEGKSIAGADPDYALIGKTSVEQLDLLLRTNKHGIPSRPLTVQVPSEWVPGDTMPDMAIVQGRGKRSRTATGA